MRQLTSIHQQIDHKIRIEGSSMSQELKPVCTKSAGEPILDAHFQTDVGTIVTVVLSYNQQDSQTPCDDSKEIVLVYRRRT